MLHQSHRRNCFWSLISCLLVATTTGAIDDDILWAKLSDDTTRIPLVGFGVGNLQHDLISEMVEKALADDKKTYLIDTAHASGNYDLIVKGIRNGVKAAQQNNIKKSGINSKKKKMEIHVVTKVWYTHLGYERTKLAVKEALEALKDPNIKVHMLIHWPRCSDDIPWMNCVQEENDLPEEVKKAGPPPHKNKDTAFLDSWRALEDIYMGKVKFGKGLPKLESIGVSNFALDDMKALEKIQSITPRMLQGNVWSYLFDPYLMDYLEQHNILFQSFNSVNGVFYEREFTDAPNAILALNDIKDDLSARGGSNYTLPQVLFKWLVQNGVSIIPRTSSELRLDENSAKTIAGMPDLRKIEQDTVKNSVAGLLTKEDIRPPLAEWINKAEKGIMNIFWVHAETGGEVPVREKLAPGETYSAYSQRGHKFVVYYEGTDIRKEMTVHAQHGQHQRFDLKSSEEL